MFIYDYRSYGNSENSQISEEAFIEDAYSIFNFLTKSGVNPTDIILMGHSLGGKIF